MIFLDSGPIIAYFNAGDRFHAAAAKGFERLGRSEERVVTSSLCVAEAVGVLARDTGDYGRAAKAGMDVLQWEMDVVRPTLADEKRALKLMETYASREVSYVDCLSFAIMDARGMRVAFTFDEAHFVKLRKIKRWVAIPRG